MAFLTSDPLKKGIFGAIETFTDTPTIQFSNPYAIDPANRDDLEVFSATGGSVDANNNLFRCQTGTSIGGYGVVRSKGTSRYRPGEAIVGRFTASFTTGIANSLQFGGFFSLTETLAFGYDGADFGIIHEYDGAAEVQSIQITSAATSPGNVTVTLDGDAVVIALTADTVQTNAEEIRAGLEADGTVGAKWRFEQVDDAVYCIAKTVGNKTGTMSYAAGSTGSAATLTEERAGAAKSSGNVTQANWDNPTPFDGYDPTQFNVYQIEYGYLGAVGPVFSVYDPANGFVKVHQIQWANNNTTPVFGNPDMKMGWTAASLGSSGTNLTVQGASAMSAVEGLEVIQNTSLAKNNSKSSVGTTETNILTIKNRVVYGNRFNLGIVKPVQLSFELDHNKGAVISVYKNATLGGTTNYQFVDKDNSVVLSETAGTTVSNGTLIASFTVAAAGSLIDQLESLKIALYPEETLTIAAATVSGVSTTMSASLTWLEEK